MTFLLVRLETIGVRNIKKREQGVPVGQPIPIWAHAKNTLQMGFFKQSKLVD